MHAWSVERPGPIAGGALRRCDKPDPRPGAGELLVRVSACGVCRTDLHLAEGDLPPRRPATTPGHEVVGRVAELGPGPAAAEFVVGERVGIAWLRHTCGHCPQCRRGAENLCPNSRYTGWDADGGYAEYAVVPAGYAYRLPDGYPDEQAAPLLCAGIVGFRAYRRADLPSGGRLGIWGFGASAHLIGQLAVAEGAELFVFTRTERARELARSLGAVFAGDSFDPSPAPLDAAITFAPAGELVPAALAALAPGGTLSIAGIYLSQIPTLDYERHLFRERQVRSTTANTRDDGCAFLAAASRHRLEVTTTPYPFAAADRALADLAGDRVHGAAVLAGGW
jgi:propanol-preferring alcohol dehydrogenase